MVRVGVDRDLILVVGAVSDGLRIGQRPSRRRSGKTAAGRPQPNAENPINSSPLHADARRMLEALGDRVRPLGRVGRWRGALSIDIDGSAAVVGGLPARVRVANRSRPRGIEHAVRYG